MTRPAYAGIFAGTIDKWNAPEIAAANPRLVLPDLAIARIVRQDSSGTTFAFSSHLAAISDTFSRQSPPGTVVEWRGQAMRANGNEGVAGMIKTYHGTIGYVGFEFAKKLGLDMAALQNQAGAFVAPSEGACGAGLASAQLPANLRVFVTDPAGPDAYPIVTFVGTRSEECERANRGGDPQFLPLGAHRRAAVCKSARVTCHYRTRWQRKGWRRSADRDVNATS